MLPPKLKRKKRREQQVRSPAHLRFVRAHACSVPGCERRPIEAAHVGGDKGVSLKCGDHMTISLCGGPDGHHAEQHRVGIKTFAATYRMDLTALAAEFWKQSPARIKYERAA